MQIDELPKVGYVLRGFVGNTCDIILIDQQSRGPAIGALHFLNIDDSAISDAANAVEPGSAFSLHLVGGLRLAAQQEVGRSENSSSDKNQNIEMNRSHIRAV